MARLARLSIAGHPHHVVLRGGHGIAIFHSADEYGFFLDSLRVAAREKHVAIHAYVLMPDHVHLLVTPATAAALGGVMQSLGRRYVRWFNRRHHREGALWDGRYRSSVIDASQYLLDCCRYIETNPVRAGLIADAANYPWSSLAHHLGLVADPLVSDHPVVWSLGNTPFERQSAYRDLVARPLAAERIERLRWGAKGGWGVGAPDFIAELERASKRPLSPRTRGRKRQLVAGRGEDAQESRESNSVPFLA